MKHKTLTVAGLLLAAVMMMVAMFATPASAGEGNPEKSELFDQSQLADQPMPPSDSQANIRGGSGDDGPRYMDFTKVVCKSYSNIVGNEVDANTPNHDDTNGGSAFYAPGHVGEVTGPGPVYDGCETKEGWSFTIGTYADVTSGGGRVVTVADGVATPTGFKIKLTSTESNLAGGHGGLWVKENMEEDYLFGALRCGKDALHNDNLEGVFNYHSDTLYCVAYNVHKDSPPIPVAANPLVWFALVGGLALAGGLYVARRRTA